jgi:hypothetical protein
MTWPPKIRGWKALALLAAVFALILLLLPQAANHHSAALVFLLVPFFLFLEPVAATVVYAPRNDHAFAPNAHVRYTLFQRPPPSQA